VCRFKELESEDNEYEILEGCHLEVALCTWSQFADDCTGTHEASVMQLQHDLRRCICRRDDLKLTCDSLSAHHTALASEIAQSENMITANKAELQCIAEQVQVNNSNVSAVYSFI